MENMEIIESLRIAMRQRIILKAKIIPAAQFQMEGKNAPEDADLYIRETIIQSDVTEPAQNTLRYQYLCEYDCFVKRSDLPDVTGQLYRLGGLLRQEFPAGSIIDIPDPANIQCFVSSPVLFNAITQEQDLFELPVIINVEIIADRSEV
jgi:hypothetical protein